MKSHPSTAEPPENRKRAEKSNNWRAKEAEESVTAEKSDSDDEPSVKRPRQRMEVVIERPLQNKQVRFDDERVEEETIPVPYKDVPPIKHKDIPRVETRKENIPVLSKEKAYKLSPPHV